VVVARQVRAKDIPGILADDNDEETELEGDNDDAVDAGERRELAEDLADAADPDVVPSEVHRFHEVIRDGERQANVDGQGGGQPAGLQNGEAGGREESGQRPRLAWSGEGMTNLTVPTADASIWMSTLQEVQRQTSLPLWPIRVTSVSIGTHRSCTDQMMYMLTVPRAKDAAETTAKAMKRMPLQIEILL
jgi:hypothetical protein